MRGSLTLKLFQSAVLVREFHVFITSYTCELYYCYYYYYYYYCYYYYYFNNVFMISQPKTQHFFQIPKSVTIPKNSGLIQNSPIQHAGMTRWPFKPSRIFLLVVAVDNGLVSLWLWSK